MNRTLRQGTHHLVHSQLEVRSSQCQSCTHQHFDSTKCPCLLAGNVLTHTAPKTAECLQQATSHLMTLLLLYSSMYTYIRIFTAGARVCHSNILIQPELA